MLEARAISVCFGNQVVLRKINLTVAPGEVVGLVGMNGSGKTTLLDALSGKTRVDSGEVWVDGSRVVPRPSFAPQPPIFRSYQMPRLFYGLSVANNLKLGRWAVGANNEVDNTSLANVARDRLADTLSVGQRRRIVLDWLRNRIKHAKYFLLDEPAAGADDALVGLLTGFLEAARRHRRGVLLVEHRDGVLKEACDRIVYLRDGACSMDPLGNGTEPVPQPLVEVPLADAHASPRLVAHHLVVARGNAIVLNGVSFEVNVGEVVAVTGPNGCGKSTLLRAIYGDLSCPVASGTLASEGSDLAAMSLRERVERGIHLLPQEGTLFPSMTVEDALHTSVEAIYPEAWNAEAIDRIRRELPIIDRVWDRPCGLLSGGERRLVSLARVLLLRPKIALLDEPLAGVDADGRRRVVHLIEHLAADGAAVVVAEQEALATQLPATRCLTVGPPMQAQASGHDGS